MTNRKFISMIVATLALSSISAYSNEPTKPPAPLKIACIGDSITFGVGIKDRAVNSYPAQLSEMLGGNTIVRNFGVSGATLLRKGNNPYWKRQNYKTALEFNPNIVIIKLGTNDSKPVNWKYKSEYISDYIDLIESFQKLASKPTVWICYPAPAYPGRWGITDTVMKEEIIPMIDTISKQADVEIIDLYSALNDRKELFPDSVHPNAAGAKIMAETIATVITKSKL